MLGELDKEGIETELVELSGSNIRVPGLPRMFDPERPTVLAGQRYGERLIEKMAAADGILLGSPTYVADVSPEIKALIDRACMVGNANGDMFR